MENTTDNNLTLLQETFDTLEAIMPATAAETREKSNRIARILEGRLTPQQCRKVCNLVYATYKILPDRNRQVLESRVRLYCEDRISEDEASKILNIIVFNTETLTDETDILSGMIQANSGLGINAGTGDEVENASGEFGLDPTNPIPVNGIDMIDDYFSKLKLVTGELISYTRKGSILAENLPNPVDVYQIYNAESENIATLYVYAYHGRMSGKAPQGFRLRV